MQAGHTPDVWRQSLAPRSGWGLQDVLKIHDRLNVPVLVIALTGLAGVEFFRQHPSGFRPQHVVVNAVAHIGDPLRGDSEGDHAESKTLGSGFASPTTAESVMTTTSTFARTDLADTVLPELLF